ncbi:conserved hypothetical protein [Novosphingobium sp. 9U]|nr:conserved hypothetical protein [Novosphingobium sp. 9U]
MRKSGFYKRLLRDRRGTSAVEYGIILGIIVFGIMLAISGVASETLKMWTHVNTEAAKAQQTN